jgi:hypothetical protein
MGSEGTGVYGIAPSVVDLSIDLDTPRGACE